MSIFWPDVQEEAGRRSAVSRGFWGGVVITMLTALGPPPMGAVSLVVFGLITAGIALKQPWAPRAGVLAAYAPLLLAVRQPDSSLVIGAFFQCTILAYFFFSAWRGLRSQAGVLQWVSGVLWLALSLGFTYAWHLSGGVQRLPDGYSNERLIAGDTVLVRPIDGDPKAGDIVLVRSKAANTPPQFERVKVDRTFAAGEVLGVATWLVWSDGAQPTDAPLAFYTKARWDRFPTRLN